MSIKREIVIEVDDKGAIKSIDGLTDALEDNTTATKPCSNGSDGFELALLRSLM